MEQLEASNSTNMLLPSTPNPMAPLSRELESVIAQRNILTCRTRRKVLKDLVGAAAEEEVIISFWTDTPINYKYSPGTILVI